MNEHSRRENATAPVLDTGSLRHRWFPIVTAGEATGFAVPALAGTVALDTGAAAEFALMVSAGTVEGAILGLAQGSVLSRALPGVSCRRWVFATAMGAAVAWAIGMLPATLGDRLVELPISMFVVLAPVLALMLLASLGLFQWRVLRGRARHAVRWIPATAAAWLAGLTVFTAFTSPLWRPGQPPWLVTVIGVLGGVLMAATVAVITGLVLHRLPADRNPVPRR